MYINGNFAALDYGNMTANLHKYNQSVPPPYNLSLVTHPISLHYGDGDLLVTKKGILLTLDMDFTEKKLPNPVGIFPVPFKNFNHMDFMWGIDAKKLLYDRLIVIMDKYR
ncbi:hypothetical protein NQ314_014711 [Rhamnusium bicolor]|uniref:Uncharacterized protein n=1 Tax=Rhamnusium bicolor TaxID=1586634 RepID=A0AAV8X1J9_9CUCU|nr:hypothetical protein NQ314_014711 [Rhamnusium bicolor]